MVTVRSKLSEKIENQASYYNYDRFEMLKFIPPDVKRVLDVGCAEGSFGKLLKSSMPTEVWGVENYDEAAQKAEKVLDRVLTGNIENNEIELPDHYFDCIVFNDVLEHLSDPWRILRKIKNTLKDNGVIIASIPNVRYFRNIIDLLIHRNWEYVEAGIMDKTHLRFFTKKSMVKMFESCGYQIMTLEGIHGASYKFNLLNMAFLNTIDDMRYAQFACVVRKREV